MCNTKVWCCRPSPPLPPNRQSCHHDIYDMNCLLQLEGCCEGCCSFWELPADAQVDGWLAGACLIRSERL